LRKQLNYPEVIMTIIGLDPHKDQHVAVAIDGNGCILGCYQLANQPAAFVGLKRWAKQFSQVRWAIEGATGRFAWPVSRYLHQQGESIYPIHPGLTSQYRSRAKQAKDDRLDAEHAAKVLLANPALPSYLPSADILTLQALTRQRQRLVSERKAHRQALASLRSAVSTITESLTQLITALDQAIGQLEAELTQRIRQLAPALLALPGVGVVIAAVLLAEIGDIGRFASEHHLASYCGAAPIRRGSGKSMRLCVNPGGNRRLNHVLHLAVMTRLRLNQRGVRDYYEAKQGQGKSKREAIRLLKTYLAREVYRALKATARTDVLPT
jgi:transposase